MHFLSHNDSNRSTCYSIPTNDVSFSIPEWKHQEIKSISHDFEREIYQAVPLSLTDFDSLQEVEFLTKPEKPPNDSYAYQRTLIYSQDFCILVFIICFEQVLLAGQGGRPGVEVQGPALCARPRRGVLELGPEAMPGS